MFYGVYEGEDSATPGRFVQGNKHYDPDDKYEDQLHALGHRFVKANLPGLLSPDTWMASTRPGSIVPFHKRPLMRAVVNKTTIKADGNDFAALTGAPKNVRCTVHGAGELLYDVVLPDGVIELDSPCPITYRVVLEKWPYQMFTVDIEAVA